MKVKEFVDKIEELGFNKDTEIVFNMDTGNEKTKDFYCQSIYTVLGYNAIGIDIDDIYK